MRSIRLIKNHLKELRMSIFVKGFLDYSAKAFRGSLGKKLVEHGAKALIFLLCVRDLCEHLLTIWKGSSMKIYL